MLLMKTIVFASNGMIYFKLLGRRVISPELMRYIEVTVDRTAIKKWVAAKRHLEGTAGEEGKRTGRKKECRKGVRVHHDV